MKSRASIAPFALLSRPPQRPRGFTLVELLIIVLLLGVFLILLNQLFLVTIRAKAAAQQRDALLHRIDDSILALRRDVWAASDIQSDGPQLRLNARTGPAITWTYAPTGILTRTSSTDAPRRWPALPPLWFTASKNLVTLHLHATEGDETITLPSQQLLASRAEETQ